MSDPTQNLFQNEPTSSDAAVQDPAPAAPTSDPYGTLLQGITTEDGRQKYGTVSDALTSIPHKEQHITTLEAENKVFQDEVANLKAQLEAAQTVQVPPTNTDNGNNQTGEPATAIDVNQIIEQVYDGLSARERQNVHKQRITEFRGKLVEAYGEKAAEVYKQHLAESGLSEQVVLKAEAESPGAAWKFLGLNKETVTNTTVPAGTRNSQASVQTPPKEAPSFRPSGQYKPGSRLAEIRAELEAAGKI